MGPVVVERASRGLVSVVGVGVVVMVVGMGWVLQGVVVGMVRIHGSLVGGARQNGVGGVQGELVGGDVVHRGGRGRAPRHAGGGVVAKQAERVHGHGVGGGGRGRGIAVVAGHGVHAEAGVLKEGGVLMGAPGVREQRKVRGHLRGHVAGRFGGGRVGPGGRGVEHAAQKGRSGGRGGVCLVVMRVVVVVVGVMGRPSRRGRQTGGQGREVKVREGRVKHVLWHGGLHFSG